MTTRLYTLLLTGFLLLAAGAVQARDVVIFAAASLKNALDQAVGVFEATTGQSVAVSYAGSSALARQIQQGAPADLFISANLMWMDVLQDQGLVRANSRRVLAGNRLVVIGRQAQPLDLTAQAFRAALGPDGRLAMALVDAVPAGIYGKAALQNLGLWDALAPSVAQTDNVRAALRLVALGEAPLGIVYATDAAQETDVQIVARFDPETHPPILYPLALVSDSTHAKAPDLLAFLTSPAAQDILTAHGFLQGPAQ
ncbi:molybdate ABC transporter substrate-binding protein [Aestuariivita boseongensis]|uniref:molybdate ABC transporter substrate-binding protein n=1 Tax=Aestuariivita boseongensis TaxID=1470562 RepID=UPI000680D6C3|nr:molybdate ABC transporter substrate-binding protein [Aestuariivita boseongensis]